MTVAGSTFTLAAGDIFIINPGEPHSLQSLEGEPHSYVILIIPDRILDMAVSEMYGPGFKLVFTNCIRDSKESVLRFKELFKVLNSPDSMLESESVLFSFLEYLISYYSNSGLPAENRKSSSSVRLAAEYIDKNFTEQITLEDLSDITGLSPFHLNRSFTSETGVSPHSYQIHRRIEFSKRLLLEGYSIAYVSAESGFTDQSHYTRFFKKITGTTPGRFVEYNR